MHLPVETAATRCNDPNTAVWCDDWLREEAGAGGVEQHIHTRISAAAPLKFKYLYKQEMDPSPFASIYSSFWAPYLSLFVVSSPCSIFPLLTSLHRVPSESMKGGRRERGAAQSSILNQSRGIKICVIARKPSKCRHTCALICCSVERLLSLILQRVMLLPSSPR